MKKIFSLLIILTMCFILGSCDIIDNVKKNVVENAVEVITDYAGIEGFELPDAKTYNLAYHYSEEEDVSSIEIEVVLPKEDLETYKAEVEEIINEAITKFNSENDNQSIESIEAVEIEGGYRWLIAGEICNNTSGESIPSEACLEVVVDGDNWNIKFYVTGVGDVLGSGLKQFDQPDQSEK